MASRYCKKDYLCTARLQAYIEQFKYVNEGDRVLEIGGGAGIFKCITDAIASIDILDFDLETRPDIVGDVTDSVLIGSLRGKYNKVFCNQVLEHIPFGKAQDAFRNILDLDPELLCISIPDNRKFVRGKIKLPLVKFDFVFTVPGTGQPIHIGEHGQHYWELSCVNKKEITDFFVQEAARCGFILEKEYRLYHRPYQHFFIFRKIKG